MDKLMEYYQIVIARMAKILDEERGNIEQAAAVISESQKRR